MISSLRHPYPLFTHNRLQQVAVERELEIIGEALKRLERSDECLFEKIENARKIIGMRNVLAHGYDVIDYRILWSVILRFKVHHLFALQSAPP